MDIQPHGGLIVPHGRYPIASCPKVLPHAVPPFLTSNISSCTKKCMSKTTIHLIIKQAGQPYPPRQEPLLPRRSGIRYVKAAPLLLPGSRLSARPPMCGQHWMKSDEPSRSTRILSFSYSATRAVALTLESSPYSSSHPLELHRQDGAAGSRQWQGRRPEARRSARSINSLCAPSNPR